MSRRIPLAMAAAALSVGCRGPADSIAEYRIFAMGTWVELVAPAADDATIAAAMPAVESMLREFGRDYYAWGDGELAALNRALGRGESFEASAELADLVAEARALAAASDGTFEPAVAPLVEAWGFHDAAAEPSSPPDAAAIAAILESLSTVGAVQIDGRRISAPGQKPRLDLGGIAKGRAVDRIIELLAANGAGNVLVNAGGDLRVRGNPPGRDWRIGIQAPRGAGSVGVIELRDGEAAFTSGDYERFFDSDNGRMHHLLDPATGYPATHTQAVTVIAPDGTTADAAATALFVAGPERWPAVAAALGIMHVLRVDASGTISVTPAMRDRLQISAGVEQRIIVTGH